MICPKIGRFSLHGDILSIGHLHYQDLSTIRREVWTVIWYIVPFRQLSRRHARRSVNDVYHRATSRAGPPRVPPSRQRPCGEAEHPKPPHLAPLLGLPQVIPLTTLKVSRPSTAYGKRSACISVSNCVACLVVIVSRERMLRACLAAM